MAFAYRNGTLCADEVSLEDIARLYGTPCYVYSANAIDRAYDAFRQALVRFKHDHPAAIELVHSTHKVSDMMRAMIDELVVRSPIRLQWYLEGRSRGELVAIFLGMLELVRLGGISLTQHEAFGEIVIKRGDKEIDVSQFAMFDH